MLVIKHEKTVIEKTEEGMKYADKLVKRLVKDGEYDKTEDGDMFISVFATKTVRVNA